MKQASAWGESTSEMLAKVARLGQDTRLIRARAPVEDGTYVIHRVQGSEALSTPYRFTVDMLSLDGLLELKQVIGQPMCVIVKVEDVGDRVFHGYVREFARVGMDGGLARYRLELAPWFSFLDVTSNCRVFQDLSVPDIVGEVFEAYADLAQFRFDIDKTRYPPLKYCVQYNESDLAFVSRLLEDAGIHYSFEHTQDGHTLVLADDSTDCAQIDGDEQVLYHATDDDNPHYGLETWVARRRIGSTLQALKSFDFKQPRSALSVDQPLDVPCGRFARLESYRYEGAARYGDSDVGQALAGLRAEETAWQTKLFEGSGNHRMLQPGRYFLLRGHYDHTETDEQARRFLVVRADYDMRNNISDGLEEAGDVAYACTVTCLRRKVPYRPVRATPRPRMPGPQTATVVGPPHEDIHADRYGRVKVQFPWDRLGQFSESSSCWVRVASPWAGADMGGVSVPRVGQEVVVDFLDGDPDRPIIVGRVYNEDNMPPFGLEVSGIKSKTVNGEGFNELTMHDSPGKQMLNMHAQRDMATTVQNDQTATINNNKSTSVASNHSMSVGANQNIAVGGTRGIEVTGDDSLGVTGARTTSIAGTCTTTVTGAATETLQGGRTVTVDVGHTETINGPYETSVAGDFTSNRTGTWIETVTGTSTRNVTGLVSETLDAGRTTQVTGDDTRGVSGKVDDNNQGDRTVSVGGKLEQGVATTMEVSSGGDMTMGSGGTMALGAASEVAIGVGESSGISITGGEIVISSGGSTIVIDASGVTINGAKINLNA